MSRVLTDNAAAELWRSKHRRLISKYPWNEWFDGRTWVLVRGEDFETTVGNIRATIYDAARTRGLIARTTALSGTELAVVVFKKGEEDPTWHE